MTVTQGLGAVFVFSLVLSACSSTPRIEDMSSADRAKIASLAILDGPPTRPFEIVGTVDGLACKRNAYMETEVARQEAFDEIRLKAAGMNADAVVNVVCQKSSSADWRNNCWASDKCIGDAIRWKQ